MYRQVIDNTVINCHFLHDAFGLALDAHFREAISPFDQSMVLFSWLRCMVEGWVMISFDAKCKLPCQVLREGPEVGPVLFRKLVVGILAYNICIVAAHHC